MPQIGVFQCPECGALWNPGKNELNTRLNVRKNRYAILLRKQSELAATKPEDVTSEYKIKSSKLKTDILIEEHALRCLREELKGNPVQIWQMRYAKALEVARSMMTDERYNKFKDALDAACKPKEIR